MTPNIQPWHREAAKFIANQSTLPGSDGGHAGISDQDAAEYIAAHDPAAADRELLKGCERALGALTDKLHSLPKDDRYMAPWIMYALHGQKYEGPFYDDELKSATAFVAKLRARLSPHE